jgi:hypothetical protein
MFTARMLIIIGLFSATSLFSSDKPSELPLYYKDCDPKLFATLPQELYALCSLDYSDIFGEPWKQRRSPHFFSTYHDILSSKNFPEYKRNGGRLNNVSELSFQKIKTELLILGLQFLQQHGITLTYKNHPYIALCIYKQCHQDPKQFETIASGVLSTNKGVAALLEYPLIKVLGKTFFEKVQSYDEASKIRKKIVDDFRTILLQKSPHFIFPTVQKAAKNISDFDTTGQRLFQTHNQLDTKKPESQWSRSHGHILLKAPLFYDENQQKIYLVAHPSLTGFYRMYGRGYPRGHAPYYPYICVQTSESDKKFFLTAKAGRDYSDNPIDLNFYAAYSLPDVTKKTDLLIHALLKKSPHVKNIPPTFSALLYRKAASTHTKSMITWVFPHTKTNNDQLYNFTEMLNTVMHHVATNISIKEKDFWTVHNTTWGYNNSSRYYLEIQDGTFTHAYINFDTSATITDASGQ